MHFQNPIIQDLDSNIIHVSSIAEKGRQRNIKSLKEQLLTVKMRTQKMENNRIKEDAKKSPEKVSCEK